MFISQMEELEDGEVDEVIEMGVEDTLETSVNKAIDGCVRLLDVPRPSQDAIEEALRTAQGYEPKTKAAAGGGKKKKDTSPRYFGLLPEVNLKDVIGPSLSAAGDIHFWESLVSRDRVTSRPHVTITHRNSLPAENELWERCMNLHRMASPPIFKFKLGHVVWNERVMALTVEQMEPETSRDDSGQEAQQFTSLLPADIKNRLHVTVGTKDGSIPAVEAKDLVEEWRKGVNMDGVRSIELKDVSATGRVKGLFG